MLNQTKIIKVLRANSPEDIAKKVNIELNNGVFASPIIQDNTTNQWISFIYSRECRNEEITKVPIIPNEEPKVSPSNSKIIKQEPITEKQIKFLKANGWKGKLPETKLEARIIIKEAIENKEI
jgi:hypothetical protein